MVEQDNPYQELLELIKLWISFKEKFPKGEFAEFGSWLTEPRIVKSENDYTNRFITNYAQGMEEVKQVPDLANRGIVGNIVGRLVLFVKNYTKIPFQEIGLGSMDEFRILSLLHRMGSPSKSELSEASLMEFTTINDMLKRMKRKGWVEQRKDEQDRRLSRVQLTMAGKDYVAKVYKTMAGIRPSVLGDLTPDEQSQLVELLKKLDDFHTDYNKKHIK